MRKIKKNEILGVLLILLGVLFLGNSLKLWKFNVFFDGWWTFFIMIPAIINIFKGNDVISQLLVFLVGLVLFFISQGLVSWGFFGNVLLPIASVIVGVIVLFNIKIKNLPKIKKYEPKPNDTNFTALFCNTEAKVNYKIKKSNCVAVFGNVILDLTKAKIDGELNIDVVCIFGSVSLITSNEVDVKATGTAMFGSTNDSVLQEVNKKSSTIYLNYTCIFGGIDIK